METPGLEYLVKAYLHQDFDLIGDVWANVDAFVDGSPRLAAGLPREVEWVLQRYDSEEELDAFIHRLGSELSFSDEPGGYRGWLREIARRVQARLAEQN